ncbi:hypothetical protein Vadar_012436 [Vaccinium darrowii]|uniref:Uncharacterized protein n=1 Tax=Vaccinium darrowii TaxID=229202 RepID=A0ACB7Z382_9ERIC|nr:hypothetical protein Vadar_012436 [Vaccinium darrowii]
MGGLNVLISFDSLESLKDFLKDKDMLLPKWFSYVEAWDNQKIKSSRCVWISCFGVPLNAWCSSTFINIGKLWGDVIRIDELTEKSIAFDKGRLFILTDYLDCINEVKKWYDFVGKEVLVEYESGEDDSVDLEVKDAQLEISGGDSRVILLDASIPNEHDLVDVANLDDGLSNLHALNEDGLVSDVPTSLLENNGFRGDLLNLVAKK